MAVPAPRPRARPVRGWAGLERWQRVLATITVAGFAVRLAWVLFAARTPLAGHDPYYYLAYAERLADGHGYTTPQGAATGYYPVGYPSVLAGALWLVRLLPGSHVLGAALALNLVAGTATIALVGLLGCRVAGPRSGCGAAAIVAFLPNFVFHTAAVLSETTFNLVLAGALLVLCWRPWGEPWSPRRVAAAGGLVGCAALVRPVALVLVPVVIAGWLVARADRRQLVRRVVVFAAVVLVVVGPWAMRNRAALGRLSLSTNTGDNLCIGNNPEATGGFNLAPYCFAEEPPELYLTGGGGRDQRMTQRATDWFRGHLSAEPALVLWRTYDTFVDDHDGVRAVQSYEADPWIQPRHAAFLATAGDGAYFAVLALAGIGVFRFARRATRDARLTLLLAVAAALVVAVWPFFGDARFHLPVVLVLSIPAGHALAIVLDRGAPADLGP